MTIETIAIFLNKFEFFGICLLALCLGAIIGLEREYTQKPAGLKTHVLICVGAAVFTYLSIHFSEFGDPGRISAQIVSGIGFIGGGAILHSKRIIKGLTTAATLWMVTAVGMCVGAGFFIPAASVTAMVSIFLISANVFRNSEEIKRHYSINIQISDPSVLEVIDDMIDKFELLIEQKNLKRKEALFFELSYRCNSISHHLFIKRLLSLKGLGDIISI